MSVDINTADCMIDKSHLGYDTFINVCNGNSYNVTWTWLDWVGCSFVLVLVLAVISFLGIVIYTVIKDR